jgi:hypothetical protein
VFWGGDTVCVFGEGIDFDNYCLDVLRVKMSKCTESLVFRLQVVGMGV